MALAITRTARRTLNALTFGWYGRQQQKQMPMMWPQWYNGNPQWRMVDSKAYIEEGYGMNSIIYSAVTWKAKNMTQAPMRAYTGDHENPELLPVKHPLSKLIARPNVYQTQRQFMTLLEVFLNVSGNAFILLDRPYLNKPPVAMYPLSTEHVRIVPINGREVGYLFVPEGSDQRNGTPILASDMIHIKLPNPIDPLEGQGFGLSPIAAMAKTADSDNRATGYIYNLFRRGVMMGGVLSFKDPISDEVLARTRTRWQEQYGGSERWDRIGILDNGANYERIVPTFDELGFGPIDERSETRMLAPFGVPPIVVGSRIGLMRCLPADAMIATTHGSKRIVDIVAGDTVWSFVGNELKPRQVTHMQKTGHKPLFEVRTKNRTLRATDNHPLLVRVPGNSNGGNAERSVSYTWKSIADLVVGDYIVQPKSYPEQGGNRLPDGTIATVDFMKYCGALLGDGTVNIQAGTIQMSMPPTDRCFDQYKSLTEQLFKSTHTRKNGTVTAQCLNCGCEINVNKSRYENGRGRFCSKACMYVARENVALQPSIMVHQETLEWTPVQVTVGKRSFVFKSKKTAQYLNAIGFGGRAHTKRVPSWVFGLHRDLRLAILAGLVDTDGSIDKRGVLQFSFCNQQLTYDVRELLISVGIQCSNIKQSFMSPDNLPNKGTQKEYWAYVFVASSAKQVAQIPFEDARYRQRVDENIHRFKADGKDAQNAGLSSDLGFYQIVSITELPPEDVYDITVEDGHSFIANGVLVHNSTYANYEQARKAAWEDTLLYEINLFGEDFEYHLSPDDETFVRPDISQVFAFKENRTEQVTTAKTLFDMGVPPRIAFQTAGLRVEEYEGMDTSWMAMGLHDANAEPAPIPTALQPFAGGQPQDGEDTPPADPENEGTVNAADVEGDTPAKTPKKGLNSGKKKRMRPTPTHRWS